MDQTMIMSKVDHTLLNQAATWEEIRSLCDDAMLYSTASVCIPPSFVKQAAEYLRSRVKICTVIGFPNGYQTTAVKCVETADAIANGADEIDMVINIGMVKERNYDRILDEIRQIKDACQGRILKVIIETCLLTEEEKIELCRVVVASGADYIKTSTGFSHAGATFEDIALFAKYTEKKIGIKAAGGIRDFEDAERFIELGATRLGTSRLVALLKK